jgi:hypothetical protein
MMIFGVIMLCQYCKKYVWHSAGGTFLLAFVLTFYFCIFLLFSAIRSLAMRSAWLEELKRYGAPAKRN